LPVPSVTLQSQHAGVPARIFTARIKRVLNFTSLGAIVGPLCGLPHPIRRWSYWMLSCESRQSYRSPPASALAEEPTPTIVTSSRGMRARADYVDWRNGVFLLLLTFNANTRVDNSQYHKILCIVAVTVLDVQFTPLLLIV
jgi:hypothetical protein